MSTDELEARAVADRALRTLIWETDPIEFALEAPRFETDERQLCVLLGQRLLRAQLDFSQWVLRRVEKVRFVSDRRVSRSTSIELDVPDYAPVLQMQDGTRHWLIPITVMRRRILVNLDLRDEAGQTLGMLGMRFTQKLDEALLRAAAAGVALNRSTRGEADGDPDPNGTADIDGFIRRAISGDWHEVSGARAEFDSWKSTRAHPKPDAIPSPLEPYFEDAVFGSVIERLWHNFTLYVTLPVETGRHRVLRLSFEERVVWRYQRPSVTPKGPPRKVLEYWPMHKHVRMKDSLRENFGLRATRIRFLTPSAELCASYHFEFVAPTSLGISHAALLAGQPNDRPARESDQPVEHALAWDEAENPGQSVGLHAVGVPRGSLCRCQVDLRIPSRGWLATLLGSCLAIFTVLVSVIWHMGEIGDPGQWSVEQVTNIVLLLVTVCAGAATYIAQHHANEVAARMVSGLRGLGGLALTMPAFAALLLVYLRDDLAESASSRPIWLAYGMWTLLAISAIVTVLVGLAFLATWRMERRHGRPSPRDMTDVVQRPDDPSRLIRVLRFLRVLSPVETTPRDVDTSDFWGAARELGFTRAAVGVSSAEGWREIYAWSDASDVHRVDLSTDPAGCRCTDRFEHGQLSMHMGPLPASDSGPGPRG